MAMLEEDRQHERVDLPPRADDLPIWSWPQAAVIAVRVGVVVLGGLLVKTVAGRSGRGWAVVSAVALAAGVLVAYHWLEPRTRYRSAYVWYGLSIAAGAAIYVVAGVSVDLGLSAPVALYTSVGLVMAGLSGITKRWRRPMANGRMPRTTLVVGWMSAVVAVLGGWSGLVLFRDRGDVRVLGLALVSMWLAITLLSGVVVARAGRATRGWASNGYRARPLPDRLRRRAWRALAAGSAVVVLADVWLIAHYRLDVRLVLEGTVIVLLALAVVTADGVADLAVVLSLVSLAWAFTAPSTPFSAQERSTAAVRPGDETLIALGDSFISGEGADRFYQGTNVKGGSECRRAPTAYAPLLVDRSKPNTDSALEFQSLIFLACSGAVSTDLYETPQYSGEPAAAPTTLRPNGLWTRGLTQLEALDARLRLALPSRGLVLISLGGNDASFGDIVSTCIGLGSCDEVVDIWTRALSGIRPNLDRAFTDLRKVVGPDVPVLLIPYPVPLGASRCDSSIFTQKEHTALIAYVEQLNTTVAEAARAAGFSVLDEVPSADGSTRSFQSIFDGRRLCDSAQVSGGVLPRALNYVDVNPVAGALKETTNPRNWLHNSFHPNPIGHALIADAVTHWIAANRTLIDTSSFRDLAGVEPYQASGPARDPSSVGAAAALRLPDTNSCLRPGTGWESAWSSCRTGQVLLGRYWPAMVVLTAAWSSVLAGIVLLYPLHANARRSLRARTRKVFDWFRVERKG